MLNILATETGAELTKSWRAPEFVLPTLALPAAFYLLFGVMMAQGASASAYLLATYGVFAVMGPALFGFGVGVASERERGCLELKRAAPAPAVTFIGAKLAATIAFATLALVPVYLAGAFLGDVALPRGIWLGLFAVHLAAVAPFALIGLAIGFRFGTNGAVAIANIVFLGFAVLGGLWFPAALFPDWLAAVSRLLPSYHLAEIALGLVQPNSNRPIPAHVAILVAMTVLFAAVATRAWFRQR
jgi:ABC-2 type transport system permease protein